MGYGTKEYVSGTESKRIKSLLIWILGEMMENERIIIYEGGAMFVPKCKCGRYVKADKSIETNDIAGLKDQQNATCKKCGRTKMNFIGFY